MSLKNTTRIEFSAGASISPASLVILASLGALILALAIL